MHTMRRYTEIPNTPTPYSKKASDEIKIGSILTIPHTGKAVLRYVGPIEGKSGQFVGIELLGEGATLGKNSGDVNGVQYFRTKQPGAGLFMTLEKLKNSVEYVESPPSRSSLRVSSPSGVRFNPTPSRVSSTRKGFQTPGAPPTFPKRTLSTPSSTPNIAFSPSASSSLEKEVHRLNSAKLVLENERDTFMNQVDQLKKELKSMTDSYNERESLIAELEKSLATNADKLEQMSERATMAENKLLKQRKLYEAQREELLEVIDQVEAQVNDNEQLYIGELKKLQEELNQKQEIIEDLYQKQKDLQELYEKSKASVSSTIPDDDLKNEISNLKLTNSTQIKAIEHLRKELVEKEASIVELNTQSLQLKESYISENEKMNEKLKEYKAKLEALGATVDEKEQAILTLKADLVSNATNDDSSEKSKETISKLQSEIDELNLKLLEKNELEKKVKDLNNLVDELQQTVKSNENSSDKIQELEFKLENKESLINDLKQQIVELTANGTNKRDSVSTEDSEAEVSTLRSDLKAKNEEVYALKRQIEEMKLNSQPIEDLRKKLEEKLNFIEDQELKIKHLEAEKLKSLENFEMMQGKLSELESAQKELESLKQLVEEQRHNTIEDTSVLQDREKELRSQRESYNNLENERVSVDDLKVEIDLYKSERDELLDTISGRDLEIARLTEAMNANNAHADDEKNQLLEEKTLEVELLKEELALIKADRESQGEIQALKKEIDDLKKLNSATTNRELNHQIKLLRKELELRPSLSEVQELRSQLELIDSLRRAESRTKDNEIHELKEKLNPTPTKTQAHSPALSRKYSSSQYSSPHEPKHSSVVASRASMRPLSLNRPISAQTRPSVMSQIVDGSLQIYVPDVKDPANGRPSWCGLCEREGHDSIDCPYDNDIF